MTYELNNQGRKLKGAGGTAGGIKHFFIGIIMALSGGYLLTNQIQVRTGYWGYRFHLFGGINISSFGITLIPLLLGIAMLFFNGRSKVGWILTGGSGLLIFIGIISNLHVYFLQTSLYVTLIILILLFGGLGLIARSLKTYNS